MSFAQKEQSCKFATKGRRTFASIALKELEGNNRTNITDTVIFDPMTKTMTQGTACRCACNEQDSLSSSNRKEFFLQKPF